MSLATALRLSLLGDAQGICTVRSHVQHPYIRTFASLTMGTSDPCWSRCCWILSALIDVGGGR